MKNKIRIDRKWVHYNSDQYRLTYSGELSDYQKERIGIVCKKEVDDFFESLSGVWRINDFSYLPLLNLNESYVLNDDLNTVNSTLAVGIRKRFVEEFWKAKISKTDDVSRLSFYAMVLIPTEEGFQLFDDVKSAFEAYRKIYSFLICLKSISHRKKIRALRN